MTKKTESGQIVVILLLIMIITLAIGLSIVGRSISQVTTATKSEGSARAFSAAEAGIERALNSSSVSSTIKDTLDNSSSFETTWDKSLPGTGWALEYPPIGRESFAQFWLADPTTLNRFYDDDNVELYFGVAKDYQSELENQPAVEVHIVTKKGASYESKKFFYDSYNGTASGRSNNGFGGCTTRDLNGIKIQTNNVSQDRSFYCKVLIGYRGATERGNTYPILLRVRMLYTNLSHPIAIKPVSGSLPPQVSLYRSTGISGNTRRDLTLFKQKFVVPYLFDYVLFSKGDLNK